MTDRKASDAAIERACEEMNAPLPANLWSHSSYLRPGSSSLTTHADRIQSFSDALRAHFGDNVPASLEGFVLPVEVDPVIAVIEELRASGHMNPSVHETASMLRAAFTKHGIELRAIAQDGAK